MKSFLEWCAVAVFAFFVFQWVSPLWASDDEVMVYVTVTPSPATPEQNEEVSTAIKQLINACPYLKEYNDDLEWLTASTDESQDSYLEYDLDAENWVSVRVKVNEDATTPAAWRARGHTLSFAVLANGVYINKDIGGHFCEFGQNSGFKPTN